MMTPSDFLRSVAALLNGACIPFEPAALAAFVAGHWPQIEDDPCPRTWASEFADACLLVMAR